MAPQAPSLSSAAVSLTALSAGSAESSSLRQTYQRGIEPFVLNRADVGPAEISKITANAEPSTLFSGAAGSAGGYANAPNNVGSTNNSRTSFDTDGLFGQSPSGRESQPTAKRESSARVPVISLFNTPSGKAFISRFFDVWQSKGLI
jgi:hypothetical protein